MNECDIPLKQTKKNPCTSNLQCYVAYYPKIRCRLSYEQSVHTVSLCSLNHKDLSSPEEMDLSGRNVDIFQESPF